MWCGSCGEWAERLKSSIEGDVVTTTWVCEEGHTTEVQHPQPRLFT